MNWLKGLVAPAAQFGQPDPQQPMPQPPMGGMPPYGGAPNPYGVQGSNPMMGQQPPPQQAPMGNVGNMGGLPDAMQWSTGTRTQGSPQGSLAGGAAASVGVAGGSADQRIAALEAKCVELQNDCGSLALFARTLLTMLEDNKTVTREQFIETKNRLDLLDGKMDDR